MSVSDSGTKAFFEYIFCREIIQQLQNIILVVNDEDKIIEANGAAIDAYGYSAAEIRDMYLNEFFPPESCADFYSQGTSSCIKNILFRTFNRRSSGDIFQAEGMRVRFTLPGLNGTVYAIRDISTAAYSAIQHGVIPSYFMKSSQLAPGKLIHVPKTKKKHNEYMFDPSEALGAAADIVSDLFGSCGSIACLLDEDKKSVVLKGVTGCFYETGEYPSRSYGLTSVVYESGMIAAVQDYKSWEQRVPCTSFDRLHYSVAAPMKMDGKIIGILGLGFHDPLRVMNEEELVLFQSIADMTSAVLTGSCGMPGDYFFPGIKDVKKAVSKYLPAGRHENASVETESGIKLQKKDNSISSLFDPLLNGVAFYEVIKSGDRGPSDCRLISANRSFRKIAAGIDWNNGGIEHKGLIGMESNRSDVYSKTAFSGQPFSFLEYSQDKDCYYETDVYCLGYGVIAVNIADRTEAEAGDEHCIDCLSGYDALTGLPNRYMFLKKLKESISAAGPADRQVAVIMVSFDNFKLINNILGYRAADKMIREMGRRLTAKIGNECYVSSFGKNEFAIINISPKAKDNFRGIREKLVSVIGSSWHYKNKTYYMTGKIGVSTFPYDGMDADVLARQAYIALDYANKQKKNAPLRYEPEMEKQIMNRAKMKTDLREAIRKRQFVVYYQPQVDFTGKITGVEALIRWQHPEMGLVYPLDFIPFAEENGMMIEIGELVLNEVCRQVRQWQADGLEYFSVAVNISACQFQYADMKQLICKAIESSYIDPGRLVLEITETAVMKDIKRTGQVLKDLKSIGVQIAIDDFGIEYSSLIYLKTFPVTLLKIDRMFVKDICSNNDDASIVRAIVELARNLNYTVVAEGVEKQEQMDFLKDIGCDRMQGYMFSKPLPPDQIHGVLIKGRFGEYRSSV